MTTALVFNFDDPDIGVELDLTREVSRGFILSDGARRKAPQPSPVRGTAFEAGRSRTVKRQRTVEPIDADLDRTRMFVAAARNHGGRALDLTAAQIGLDPEFALDPHRWVSPPYGRWATPVRSRPVTRLISRKSSGVMRPFCAIFRSR
jgi:hypothetical protein